jgi:hypothetical protein
MTIIFYEMIIIPFRISFSLEDLEIYQNLDLAFDFIFMADICLTFNTAIYRKGKSISLISKAS